MKEISKNIKYVRKQEKCCYKVDLKHSTYIRTFTEKGLKSIISVSTSGNKKRAKQTQRIRKKMIKIREEIDTENRKTIKDK